MTQYVELRNYSALHDAEMVRLSMADGHGREFFMMLRFDEGRRWRDRRRKALDDIQAAIDLGCEPGEVRVLEEV